MNRRTFLKMSAALPVASSMFTPLTVSSARAQQKEFMPRPGVWKTYEVTTRVEVVKPAGVSRVWVPIPVVESDYQKVAGNTWSGNAKVMDRATDAQFGAAMVYAEWPASESAPVLDV